MIKPTYENNLNITKNYAEEKNLRQIEILNKHLEFNKSVTSRKMETIQHCIQ